MKTFLRSFAIALIGLAAPLLETRAVTLPLTGSGGSTPTPTPAPMQSPTPTSGPTTIGALPFTISQPGTYVLGSSVQFSGSGSAIEVKASQVVINLNGNSIVATGAAAQVGVGIGILIDGQKDVTITGGHIDSFGLAGVFENTGSGTVMGNSKITVQNCNFNGDLYALLSISAKANVMKDCIVVGGAIAALDISGTADVYRQNVFQGQSSVSGLTAGFGVLGVSTTGILVEDCLIQGASTVALQATANDDYRFVTFAQDAANVAGGPTNEMSN